MECRKCKKEIPDDAKYCPLCGCPQNEPRQKPRTRGNGQGSVYKLSGSKTYTAAYVYGYHLSESGRAVADKVTKSGFATKKAACAYLPTLKEQGDKKAKDKAKELARQRVVERDEQRKQSRDLQAVWTQTLQQVNDPVVQQMLERTKEDAIRQAREQALDAAKPPKAKGRRLHPDMTVSMVYELWLQAYSRKKQNANAVRDYTAAYRHLSPVWYIAFGDIGLDDWQECIDECPAGRRTKVRIKALIGQLYKYAIPRGAVPDKVDMANYLEIDGANETIPRQPFTLAEIEIIRQSVGKVDYANMIYCQIYLGYRPHELTTLDISQYDRSEHYFRAGIKTEAGKNRIVTISPKIQPIIDAAIGDRQSGPVFVDPEGNAITDDRYRDIFARALKQMGIQSTPERKLTPHCCRHTFASLMDLVPGGDNTKLELIGHTSSKMLHHYQHAYIEGLRKITDNL